jgi:hypothetical protein
LWVEIGFTRFKTRYVLCIEDGSRQMAQNEDGQRRITLTVSDDLWDALCVEQERLKETRPGTRITVSDTIRELLWRALKSNRQEKPGEPR